MDSELENSQYDENRNEISIEDLDASIIESGQIIEPINMAAPLEEVMEKAFPQQLQCFTAAVNAFNKSVESLRTSYEKVPRRSKGALQVFLKQVEKKLG